MVHRLEEGGIDRRRIEGMVEQPGLDFAAERVAALRKGPRLEHALGDLGLSAKPLCEAVEIRLGEARLLDFFAQDASPPALARQRVSRPSAANKVGRRSGGDVARKGHCLD